MISCFVLAYLCYSLGYPACSVLSLVAGVLNFLLLGIKIGSSSK